MESAPRGTGAAAVCDEVLVLGGLVQFMLLLGRATRGPASWSMMRRGPCRSRSRNEQRERLVAGTGLGGGLEVGRRLSARTCRCARRSDRGHQFVSVF